MPTLPGWSIGGTGERRLDLDPGPRRRDRRPRTAAGRAAASLPGPRRGARAPARHPRRTGRSQAGAPDRRRRWLLQHRAGLLDVPRRLRARPASSPGQAPGAGHLGLAALAGHGDGLRIRPRLHGLRPRQADRGPRPHHHGAGHPAARGDRRRAPRQPLRHPGDRRRQRRRVRPHRRRRRPAHPQGPLGDGLPASGLHPPGRGLRAPGQPHPATARRRAAAVRCARRRSDRHRFRPDRSRSDHARRCARHAGCERR